MRKVQAWVTSDGQTFTDRRAAATHAEERYGAALTKLAHEAVRVEKFGPMLAWLEASLPRFAELAALHADRMEEEAGDDVG